MRLRSVARLLLLAAWCALVAVAGCGPSPAEALHEADVALAAGDDEAAQAAFRQGLERHPEDVALLLMAATFYLREHADEHDKPRLALHYARRADRADDQQRPDVDAAVVRALRAMGQREEADTALADALTVHPDDPTLLALQRTEPPSEGALALPGSLD